MCFLIQDKTLEELERRYDFTGSVEYCLNKWRSDPDNENELIRAFMQAWFICSYVEELIPIEGDPVTAIVQYVKEKKPLQYIPVVAELLEEGDRRFGHSVKWLCFSGFAIREQSVYCGIPESDKAEEESTDRFNAVLDTADEYGTLFVRAATLESYTTDGQTLAHMIPGDSVVDCYIKDILSDYHYSDSYNGN